MILLTISLSYVKVSIASFIKNLSGIEIALLSELIMLNSIEFVIPSYSISRKYFPSLYAPPGKNEYGKITCVCGSIITLF